MAIPLDPALLKSLNPDQLPSEAEIKSILDKYTAAKKDRAQSEGLEQFVNAVNVKNSKSAKTFAADPFVGLNSPSPDVDDLFPDQSCKFLVIGGGFGSLSMAARAIDAGIKPEDLRLVEVAGDYGGTWYWNRYPGAMCDSESYIYLPLLEETGYIPSHKYVYAPESVHYGRVIAKHWNFEDKSCFYTTVKTLDWDESTKQWRVVLEQARPGQSPKLRTVKSTYVFLNGGTLAVPQLPNVPGLNIFKGHCFHTSRFDYSLTGGEPGAAPEMHKLKNMNVAIIGTGASAVQCIPSLAKWAKHLYVFQRTPSQVDWRGQAPTDEKAFKESIATGPGWHRKRAENFTAQHSLDANKPADIVKDAYSQHTTWCAVAGGTRDVTAENVVEYTHKIAAIDLARSERVRARVDEIVTDSSTAASLKLWSTGFCKRPCFHDDYLPTFNRPNVTLVDTHGASIDALTPDGIMYNGTEYPVDLIIFSTGFRSPAADGTAAKTNVSVTGRDGTDLETKSKNKWATLHGCVSRGFPNLFFPGPAQGAVATCFTFALDAYARHVAFIVRQAESRSGGKPVAVEPTEEAEESWAMRAVGQAAVYAPTAHCGPSYFNAYSDPSKPLPQDVMVTMLRGAPWAYGVFDYEENLEKWRQEGEMEGLEVTY